MPAAQVPEVARECGEKGIRALVVISSGFSEVGGEGQSLQDRLLQLAAGYGMRLVGPNCMGVMNLDPAFRLNASFAPFVPSLTDLDAREMLRSLRTFPVLEGYRGSPALDVAAMEDLLLRLATLVEDVPQVAELDLKPADRAPRRAGVRRAGRPGTAGPGAAPRPTREPAPTLAGSPERLSQAASDGLSLATSTGLRLLCTILPATLPIASRSRPVRPCVATATIEPGSAAAYATTAETV